MNKTELKYGREWVARAASLIANLLYSAWRDLVIETDSDVDPRVFFESEYLLSIHPTKADWLEIVYKFFMWEVTGRRTYTTDFEDYAMGGLGALKEMYNE